MTATEKQLEDIFNEWAKRYADNPAMFGEILDDNGRPVADYGRCCAIYFAKLAKEMGI